MGITYGTLSHLRQAGQVIWAMPTARVLHGFRASHRLRRHFARYRSCIACTFLIDLHHLHINKLTIACHNPALSCQGPAKWPPTVKAIDSRPGLWRLAGIQLQSGAPSGACSDN